MNLTEVLKSYYTQIVLLCTIGGSLYKIVKTMEELFIDTKENTKQIKSMSEKIEQLQNEVRDRDKDIETLLKRDKNLHKEFIRKELAEEKFKSVKESIDKVSCKR